MGMARSSRQYFKAFRAVRKDWTKVNQQNFNRSLRRLSHEKLLEEKTLADGSFKLTLTPEGKKQAELLSFFGNSIKFKRPKEWDGKWRIVMFDIPESKRHARSAVSRKIKEFGMYPIQKSVFVSPYRCKDEIDFITIAGQKEVRQRVAALSDHGDLSLIDPEVQKHLAGAIEKSAIDLYLENWVGDGEVCFIGANSRRGVVLKDETMEMFARNSHRNPTVNLDWRYPTL